MEHPHAKRRVVHSIDFGVVGVADAQSEVVDAFLSSIRVVRFKHVAVHLRDLVPFRGDRVRGDMLPVAGKVLVEGELLFLLRGDEVLESADDVVGIEGVFVRVNGEEGWLGDYAGAAWDVCYCEEAHAFVRGELQAEGMARILCVFRGYVESQILRWRI
jgi:hypothetical protein